MDTRGFSTPDLHYDTYSHDAEPKRKHSGVNFKENPRSLSSSTVRGTPSKSKGGLVLRLFGKKGMKKDVPNRSDPRFARSPSPSPSPSPSRVEVVEAEGMDGGWSKRRFKPMLTATYGRPAKARLAYAPE